MSDTIIAMPTRGQPLHMATCHPDRPMHAKGLCHTCYDRQRVAAHGGRPKGKVPKRRRATATVIVRCPRCLSVSDVSVKQLDGDPRCGACRLLDTIEPDIPRERYVGGLRLAA